MWYAGWNLINEPRCTGCGTGPLQAWITEMTQYVKSLDPNHLLSVGAEGFYAHGAANPGGASSCALLLQNAMCKAVQQRWQHFSRRACMLCRWALNEGQDFVLNNQVAGIDFATFHCWPDKCVEQHAVKQEASPQTAHHAGSHILLHVAGWMTTCSSKMRGCDSMPQTQRRWASRCALHQTLPLLLLGVVALRLLAMHHSRRSSKRVATCAGTHGGVWQVVGSALAGNVMLRRSCLRMQWLINEQ